MRDDLTVLVQRIHPRADDFEIFEFFSQAGKVRDIRLIRDQRSGKSKGVGYVEFYDPQAVMNGLALNGIAFKGQPLLVQASMAEKNRLAQAAKNVAAASAMMGGTGPAAEPTKLVVSELHPHIAKDDVKEVFSPFGQIADIQMATDPTTGAGLGIANITFVNPTEAAGAQAAINGLELAGKRIVVTLVADAPPPAPVMPTAAMLGGLGMSGLAAMGVMPGMGAMAGLPGGIPGMPDVGAAGAAVGAPAQPPSNFVLMKNMFDPNGEEERNDPDFFLDLREDVMEETGKNGTLLDAKIVKESAGHMLLKFADQDGAGKTVQKLNGRWFAGKQITAEFCEEEVFERA